MMEINVVLRHYFIPVVKEMLVLSHYYLLMVQIQMQSKHQIYRFKLALNDEINNFIPQFLI